MMYSTPMYLKFIHRNTFKHILLKLFNGAILNCNTYITLLQVSLIHYALCKKIETVQFCIMASLVFDDLKVQVCWQHFNLMIFMFHKLLPMYNEYCAKYNTKCQDNYSSNLIHTGFKIQKLINKNNLLFMSSYLFILT